MPAEYLEETSSKRFAPEDFARAKSKKKPRKEKKSKGGGAWWLPQTMSNTAIQKEIVMKV
jgi:hypothetical protein